MPAGFRLAFSILLLCPRLPAQTTPPLQPDTVRTSITVTESISADAPVNLTTLDRQALDALPGVNLDDRLRAVPGFSLLRRSSSISANPTTQGVSLRGIGPSGASRTLLLLDGIPLNSPFGGWVYWTRLSPEETARAEVSRGASTSVFGDRAMGGAIALFSRTPEKSLVEGSYEGGGRNTHQLSGGYSNLWRRWAASVRARAFTTDGFYIVPDGVRGPVDSPAALRFAAGRMRLDSLAPRDKLFLKLDAMAEERANGTLLQNNSTSLGMISAHYHRDFSSDALSLLGYHTREMFRSTFSAISADRRTERLTSLQRVPSDSTGGAAYYRAARTRWNLLAGADTQRVEGYSTDRFFPTGIRAGGGVLHQTGAFAQTDFETGPLRLFLGAHSHRAGGQGTFFSPSAGFAAGRERWRLRGSVYRSFRAPTLNELYREFRAGNAVTLANPSLRPESLWGAEAGFDFVGESGRMGITLFRNSLDRVIANVTVASSPVEVIRRRENAGAGIARGLELDLRRKLGVVTAEASYLYTNSRFSTGLRIPQVPLHQGSAQILLPWRGTLFAAGIRSSGLQFEDDLNRDVLPGYAVAHFSLIQRLARGFSATAAVENLLDREYLAGKRPNPVLATPRLWRLGLRWQTGP